MFPYPFRKEQLADALHQNGLTQVLHNLPAGNWDAGERGIACLPDRTSEFQDGVGLAIDYAQALGCPQVNCLVGLTPQGIDGDRVRQIQTIVDLLMKAAGLPVELLETRHVRAPSRPCWSRPIARTPAASPS